VTTVGDDFPRQQERLRTCLEQGLAVGTAGRFYVAVCKEILKRADEAAISGDVVLVLRSYNEMKEFQE
jgi:hypothetical protein